MENTYGLREGYIKDLVFRSWRTYLFSGWEMAIGFSFYNYERNYAFTSVWFWIYQMLQIQLHRACNESKVHIHKYMITLWNKRTGLLLVSCVWHRRKKKKWLTDLTKCHYTVRHSWHSLYQRFILIDLMGPAKTGWGSYSSFVLSLAITSSVLKQESHEK